MLWLAIHFPSLALESFACDESGQPLAVTELFGAHQRILMCDRSAAQLGVAAGMRPGAARALAPGLRLIPRNERRETAALEAVAGWCGSFTSQVSLDPPCGIVLELAGSLRLFGGVGSLLASIGHGLKALQYSTQLCLAPTPAAAMLLAREGRESVVPDRQRLRQVLARVSLHWLPLQSGEREALHGMGLQWLGELMRLPQAGIERRLGPEFIIYLQRLLGESPDPRPQFQPPEHFRRRLELPSEVGSAPALLFAARRLILELAGFLVARQAGTQHLHWILLHSDGRQSRIQLSMRMPERDPGRLQLLLGERLERVKLPAPVRELTLLVEALEPLPGRPLPLFDEPAERGLTSLLLERLQARLGRDCLSGIELVADHRPEYAWRRSLPGEVGEQGGENPRITGLRRPLWLLRQPEMLSVKDGRPCWQGPLQLEPERERIESGWWDGEDVSRDYFIATAAGGERLWIYRELHGAQRWFVHGFF